MADEVVVKFSASIDGLMHGVEQVRSSVEGLKPAIERISDNFKALPDALVSGLIGPFQRIKNFILGLSAIVAGGQLFGDMVTATVDMTGEVNKLARTLGISVEQASNLRTELHTLGMGTDEYVQIALRLDQQVRRNEEGIRRAGVTTRDSSGALLDQQTLMMNAINALRQYKEGSDRNIAAQVLFGRSIGDINALLRMTAEAGERAKRDTADLGLGVTVQGRDNVRQYKLAVAELNNTLEGIKIAIGNAVLPYLTAFANWFRDRGPSIISGTKEAVAAIIDFAFDTARGFLDFVVEVGRGIENIFILWNAAKELFGGQTASMDTWKSLDSALTKLEQFRDKAKKTLSELQTELKAGKNPFGRDEGVPDKPGTRSAAGLINPKGGDSLAKARLEQQRIIDDATIKQAQQTNDYLHELGKKSDLEYYQDKLKLQMQLDVIDELAAQKKRDVYARGTVEWQKANNDYLKIVQENVLKEEAIRQQAVIKLRDQVETVFSSITSAWDSSIKGLLEKTMTWSQAWRSALKNMLYAFIGFLEQKAAKWAATEAAETLATLLGISTRTAAEQTANTVSIASAVAKALKAIATFAAETFGGVFAFLSPAMGPAAAGPATAASAAVAAAGAAIPQLAVGTPMVLRDGLAVIHRGEAVVPAQTAGAWRDGLGASSPPAIHISAWDGASVARWLKSGGIHTIAKALSDHMTLNPSLRPAY